MKVWLCRNNYFYDVFTKKPYFDSNLIMWKGSICDRPFDELDPDVVKRWFGVELEVGTMVSGELEIKFKEGV